MPTIRSVLFAAFALLFSACSPVLASDMTRSLYVNTKQENTFPVVRMVHGTATTLVFTDRAGHTLPVRSATAVDPAELTVHTLPPGHAGNLVFLDLAQRTAHSNTLVVTLVGNPVPVVFSIAVDGPNADVRVDVTLDALSAASGRQAALHSAGFEYGLKGGMAWTNNQQQAMLQAKAGELDKSYDFVRLAMNSGSGMVVMPPVAHVGQDGAYDFGPARIVAEIPRWMHYLTRRAVSIREVSSVLPVNEAERREWGTAVTEGWTRGVAQAAEEFRADVRRLDRDYQGMNAYMRLAGMQLSR